MTSEGATSFVKSLVRPILIVWTWILVGIMWFNQIEIPPLLLGVATTIVVEYFGERAIKRIREK